MKPDADATAKSNCCLKIQADGRSFDIAWRGKKLACGTASPLVHAGYAYFVDKNNFVICLDARTGEEQFRERLDNSQWATPIGAGDRVYFFGKDGVTTVLKTGPYFEKVASNRLWTTEDFEARKEQAKKSAVISMGPPGGRGGEGGPPRGPGGGPPLPQAGLEATRYSAVGDVVYGVAAIDGCFLIRTGTEPFCVRSQSTGP
jgi:hypothetical protein